MNRYVATASSRLTAAAGTTIGANAAPTRAPQRRQHAVLVRPTPARGRGACRRRRRRSRRCGRRRRRSRPDSAARTPCAPDRGRGGARSPPRPRASGARIFPRRGRPGAVRGAAVDEELDAGAPGAGANRVWLAAPSSPNCGAAGSGSWTTKWRASAKIARSTRVVVGASSERWKWLTRFAGVKWTRPSAVSADGLTVAAFATHIAAADEHAASSSGASCAARATTSASRPANPSARSAGRSGRSCGGSTACRKPRAASARTFARPCSAASRGFDTRCAFRSAARLPRASPA